jgi:hypothetical protein
MTGPLVVLAKLAITVIAAITRPQHARCPDGYHVERARADGTYECARPYGCRDRAGARGGWDSTCEGEQRFRGELYCTGGTRAITNADGATVGCQPHGWRDE